VPRRARRAKSWIDCSRGDDSHPPGRKVLADSKMKTLIPVLIRTEKVKIECGFRPKSFDSVASSLSWPSEARPGKSCPTRVQILCPLTAELRLPLTDFLILLPFPSNAPHRDLCKHNKKRGSGSSWKSGMSKLPNHMDVCRRRLGRWTGDPKIEESPIRYGQTTPRDPAVHRPSIRRARVHFCQNAVRTRDSSNSWVAKS
jgi:hypothetical protein